MPKKFVGESFSVSLTSGPEKIWRKEGGGVYQDFPSKIFCLTVEKFCRGILYCCNNFGYRKSLDKGGGVSRYRKSLDKGGGGVSRFSIGIFVSLYWNISLENTLVLQKNSFIENFHEEEGGITVLSELLSHRTETKSFVKEPFCFPENFWYRKKFMDKRGHITISSRNFYVSQCPKLS